MVSDGRCYSGSEQLGGRRGVVPARNGPVLRDGGRLAKYKPIKKNDMKASESFGVVIEHPVFGDIKTDAEFDGRFVSFGRPKKEINVLRAIERDMKDFEKMNEGLESTDRNYIDLDTMRLYRVHIDGSYAFLEYVFEENDYKGEKNGDRCAAGAICRWHQSYDNKNYFEISRPCFGVQTRVAW